MRIYTDGLKGCKDGGSVKAYLTPAAESGALAELPSLQEALVGLSRALVTAQVGLSASAADGEAGLSVPSGQVVTLTMTCSGAYAATQFTPSKSLFPVKTSTLLKALLFDLDKTLVASNHLDHHRRTWDHTGLQAALPTLSAPEGLAEALAVLAGEVQLGVVTTSPAWYARTVLQHVYPDVHWQALVTYGDIRARKPDPEGLMLALKQLELASAHEAAYIGDQDHELEAARRAGIQPIRATVGATHEGTLLP